MFLFVRRIIAGRLIARLSARYARLPLILAAFGILRAYSRHKADRTASITLKKGERLVVTREVDRV